MTRALVYGLAVAGTATARALVRHDVEVVAVDDTVTDERRRFAAELGIELVEAPDDDTLRSLVESCDEICPSPGVPEHHRVIAMATSAGRPLATELELAYRWEQQRPGGPRPMLAVTGTDGKTTTTLLAVAMLRAGGVATVDAGNTDTPLVDAIELDLDAFVVECTSFRLAWAPTFRADAAAWLNLAPDHLDWHRSLATYEAAKSAVFTNQRPSDAAIGFADDPVVLAHLAAAPGRQRTFGLVDADYRLEVVDGEDWLTGPDGPIAPRRSMARDLPHDITNALAASALVLEAGLVDRGAIERALGEFQGPPHRLSKIGEWDGVAWYDDSKATTPHAAATAVAAFERVVLIAGGYDKRVDLAPMAAEQGRVVALVANGDTGPALPNIFDQVERTTVVATLAEAVDAALAIAQPGDTVLLSPGCASFDQFSGFEARGDAFCDLVRAAHRSPSSPGGST